MNIQERTTPSRLEKYSFLWSEVRLIIAAIALFLGGVPPIVYILRPVGIVGLLLTLCWIISGVASAYLLYRWTKSGKTLFGKKDSKNTTAFLVSVVSGLNLGIVGVLGTNIGMSISMNRVVFLIVGIIYLISAYRLWTEWKTNGRKVF